MDSISYHDIIKKLAMLVSIHSYYIHSASAACGLYKGQLPILEQAENNENCTQKEIAEMLWISAPSVATSIKRMEKAGLLEKNCDENDLRNNRICLTDKGKELTQKCRIEFNAIDEQMFSGFSPEECSLLYQFFDRMIANLSTDEVDPQKIRELIRHAKMSGSQHRGEEEEDD